MKIIIALLNLFVLVLSLSGCDAADECNCVSESIQMSLVDEDGKAVFADSIKYTLNGGTPKTMPNDRMKSGEDDGGPDWEPYTSYSVGGQAGTYHIWVEANGQSWESEDIKIKMGGPKSCRRPQTKKLLVTFDKNNKVKADCDEVGDGC